MFNSNQYPRQTKYSLGWHRIQESTFHIFYLLYFFYSLGTIIIIRDIIIIIVGDVAAWQLVEMISMVNQIAIIGY